MATWRDRVLEADAAALLHHEPWLRGAAVECRADGSVVHLRERMRSRGQLDDPRLLVPRLRHVLAVWEDVSLFEVEPVIIDQGCGSTTQ